MKDNFSLIGLPLLLCLVPLIATVSSWQLERKANAGLSKSRRGSFRAGLLLSAFGLLAIASCWIDPYPLVRTPDGGSSIAWLDRAWAVAFAASLLSIILAFFGTGWPRVILVLSGVLSLLLAFGSVLQNGV
jgi:hypothetical protein